MDPSMPSSQRLGLTSPKCGKIKPRSTVRELTGYKVDNPVQTTSANGINRTIFLNCELQEK